MHARTRLAIAATIATLMATGRTPVLRDGTVEAQSLGRLKERRKSTQRKIQDVQKSLREVKQKQQTVAGELVGAQQELERATERLTDARQQLSRTRRELSITRQKHEEAKSRLERHKREFGNRLRLIYKYGKVTYAEVVLDATDFSDFANRAYLCERMALADNERLADLAAAQAEVAELQSELEVKEARRVELVADMAQAQATVKQAAERKRSALNRLAQSREAYEEALAELEQNSREIEAMIRSLQRGGRLRYSGTWGGSFLRPLAGGHITSGFGMRFHPIRKVWRMHPGVDISSPYGTSIRAAASGLVIFAGWWGAYGKAVIIDHGSGVSTVYGHCSSILVSKGQVVGRGTTIARVGSTGLSTGNHLHFEVRRNGSCVNPLR